MKLPECKLIGALHITLARKASGGVWDFFRADLFQSHNVHAEEQVHEFLQLQHHGILHPGEFTDRLQLQLRSFRRAAVWIGRQILRESLPRLRF